MKLEIDITRQDYYNFNLYHFKKKSLIKTAGVGLIVLLITQYFLNMEKSSLNILSLIFSSLLYLAIFSTIIYYNLSNTKSVPQENGSILGKKVYEFLDTDILYKDNNAEGRFAWQAIKSLEESKRAFYLYIDTIAAIIIPKRYFIDKTEEHAFHSFVQSKLHVA